LSRQRLDFASIDQVELAHQKYIGAGKTPAKPIGKIPGELIHEPIAVPSPFPSTLLLLKNPPPDPPIGGGHNRIDSPAGLLSRALQPTSNINE
jgi:hypothetical protein